MKDEGSEAKDPSRTQGLPGPAGKDTSPAGVRNSEALSLTLSLSLGIIIDLLARFIHSYVHSFMKNTLVSSMLGY